MGKKAPRSIRFYKLVGRRIKMAREHAKVSQKALGDHLGVSFQQVQKYENGNDRIPVDRLKDAAELLGVTPHYLMDIE